MTTRPTTSSSIILSNNNINNMHNRGSSNHLSSMVLSGGQQSNGANSHTNSRNFPSNVNSHIWSIDENMSKSHGKLASSGYLPHPYLFNNSITDVSCDNLSNASRLMDGMPTPGYYLHPAPTNNLPNNCQPLSASGQIKVPEFLPICDLMFNLISMIIYFCENVFDILALIALYYHVPTKIWALIGAVSLFSANFTCQYLSFRWLYKTKYENCKRKQEAQEELENEEDCGRRYYNRMGANMRNYQCGSCSWIPNGIAEVQLSFFISIVLDAVSHVLCLGFLIRYIKLVIPVKDTTKVKKEARDLSMLRIIHAFMQSVPLVFLQAYMICSQTNNPSSTSLSTISAILSLVNTCWALATFSKYARKKYMHKFVLTWLGIISQFLWRLGTVSSRMVALTIYAVYYNYWALVVLALHWLTMFFWLIKPGGLLKDEVNITPARKITSAIAASWIYCFCYMNFEEHNSKIKMTVYYLIMFLENNLLLTVCLIFSSQVTWFKNLSILVVYLGFVFGMMSMCIYYKYFHVNILNDGLSCSNDSIDSIADQLSAAGKKIAGFKPGTLRLKSEDSLTSGHIYNSNINNTLRNNSHPEISRTIKAHYLTSTRGSLQQTGAFNSKLDVETKKQRIQNLHLKHHS